MDVDSKDFNCKQICDLIREGFAICDEDMVTRVLATCSNKQRQIIKEMYVKTWGTQIVDDLLANIINYDEDIVLALFQKPFEYDAFRIYKALNVDDSYENTLIEIICSCSNKETEDLKTAYNRIYGTDLTQDIKYATSDEFGTLLTLFLECSRCELFSIDDKQAKEDAKMLLNAGIETWGTVGSMFNIVFASRNFNQLSYMLDQYELLTESTMEETIANDKNGYIKKKLLALIKLMRNKSMYFAERLHTTMNGDDKDESSFLRILISRLELDMLDIKKHFRAIYQLTLDAFIRTKASNKYRNILLRICCSNMRTGEISYLL